MKSVGRRRHRVRDPTNRRAIKEESKTINHVRVKNQAHSPSHNVHVTFYILFL